ncbi:hypothetical protein J421_4714 (plasmid) [Gemmatirosa kalamazoonensis]|uniref:SAF domain protein n=1 Tax=Gemmatirosa kalamazoonensis TaxID=861299 RepID=W0RMI5_9BACT|nr:hypothetical protein [Gemmatirosa kalamazoonensis]AHG92249.1 hypothetical protein J421_4714 [Gemmatirosa kalamazoonensis]
MGERVVHLALALLLGASSVRAAAQGAATEPVLPVGTRVAVRLLDAVPGTSSALGRRVRALVIAPARPPGGSRPGLAPGDTVDGVLRDAGTEHARGRRQFLTLAFDRVALADPTSRAALPLTARVADVPNARESVDAAGRVVGPQRPGVLRSRTTWAAALLGAEEPLAAAMLFAAFDAERLERHRRIAYAPGVEMTLVLTAPLALPARPAAPPLPAAPPAAADALRDAPTRVATVR